MDILIVEDNTITSVVFKKLVHTLGYAVELCTTAEAALEVCRDRFFPIIILDLGLPGIDGFEFCRRLRMLPQHQYAQVLVVTANDSPQDVQDALEAGADDYIVKPVGIELLQMRLTIMERRAHKLMEEQYAHETAAVLPLDQAVANFEKQYLENVLEQCEWDSARAAKALDLDPATLRARIEQYGLRAPAFNRDEA